MGVEIHHEENIMVQPDGSTRRDKEYLICWLRKSIYELREASGQWYLKFDLVFFLIVAMLNF